MVAPETSVIGDQRLAHNHTSSFLPHSEHQSFKLTLIRETERCAVAPPPQIPVWEEILDPIKSIRPRQTERAN